MLTRKFNLLEFAEELGKLAGEWIAARTSRTGTSAIKEPLDPALARSEVGSQRREAVDPSQPGG
jgi:hypothetical protein